MAEYIDKQAFLDHMMGTSRYFDVKFDIENFPPADVVPVVRCSDCKYCFCNHDGHIRCYNSMGLICPANNAYCCYGEEA